ncbi:amidohydrolase family protein [Paenibacillus cisolokensis]|uniref:amidohydrolase family protein n=1 Tax=Paenibacillus cisolokensis TaxID=1658519 RepID=UPI003D29F950
MKVDAHQHFWNLSRGDYPWLGPQHGPIYRTFEPEELEPELRAAGIDKTVLVQSANSYEDTEYMLELAERYEWIGGVVGWVPLPDRREAEERLKRWTKLPVFKGIRHLIHDEKDPDWVVRADVIEGLRLLAEYGMSFDVVAVFPNHLKHVPLLAESVPGLRLVIDHLAKPPIADDGWEPWAEQLARAAQYPNVCAKISGLNTAAKAGWSAADLKPYVDYAVKTFGADRLMFGSDWPVALLADEYGRVWRETNEALKDYSETDVRAMLGETAARFYRLER